MSALQKAVVFIYAADSRHRTTLLAAIIALTASFIVIPAAPAQTFTVLHTFTGGGDGSNPAAGLTMDRGGSLYGTAGGFGGSGGWGSVFKLSHVGAGWVLSTLYTFQGGTDGQMPESRVIFGPDGTLYGTTNGGGSSENGMVYNLRPRATFCPTIGCPWIKTVLYSFQGGMDGAVPGPSDLTFDSAGNIYGTTTSGGGLGEPGTVFELSRSSGQWMEQILYRFTGLNGDGSYPIGGVIFDPAGNLYGTTASGGGVLSAGTAYQLQFSGGTWNENRIYGFGLNASNPSGGFIFDQQGNLYGETNSNGVQNHGGTVYELQPNNGNWTEQVLGVIGIGPRGTPTMDAAGNLYVAQTDNEHGDHGSIFKLSPGPNGWTSTNLYHFTGGSDGSFPLGTLLLDAHGNIYGVTQYGGHFDQENCVFGCGVVWMITP